MSEFYYISHGRIIQDLESVPPGVLVQAFPRILGGKGGFGSMLRAIGSQIEKTTNREMCRDLTGRRMRDVNMEKQLKDWLAKASEREREKIEKQLERRKKRRDLLEKGPLASHKFEDNKYDEQKSFIAEQLESALETILREARENEPAGPSTSNSTGEPAQKKKRLILDKDEEDLLNELSSSSSSSGEVSDDDKNTKDETEEEIPPDASKSVPITNVIASETEDSENISSGECSRNQIPEKMSLLSEESNEKDVQKNIIPKSFSIDEAISAYQLEQLGLDTLKLELTKRGLKCGGTLSERAQRLFCVLTLEPEDYPSHLKAKPLKRKK